MKGLLIKDFYTLVRVMKMYILLIIIFSINQNGNMMVFPLVYAAMLPVTSISYDERSKWHIMARMMPYKSLDIVLEKYVLGYISMAFAAVVMMTARGILSAAGIVEFNLDYIITVVSVFFVGFILMAILLPLMFKFGTEQGRLIFIIVFAAVITLTIAAGGILGGVFTNTVVYSAVLILGFAAVILNILSVLISVRIYKLKAV